MNVDCASIFLPTGIGEMKCRTHAGRSGLVPGRSVKVSLIPACPQPCGIFTSVGQSIEDNGGRDGDLWDQNLGGVQLPYDRVAGLRRKPGAYGSQSVAERIRATGVTLPSLPHFGGREGLWVKYPIRQSSEMPKRRKPPKHRLAQPHMVKAWACALMRERGISVWKGYTDKTIAALLGIVHDGESEDDAKRALDIAYIEWQRSKKQYAAARQNPERRSSRVSAYKVDRVDDDAFLRTYEWRRLRMEAIKKYGRRCQCCGATPHDGAKIHVDHIKPRKIFPELALDIKNLQILCHECNHGKGNWDMTDWRKNEAPV